MCPSTLPTTILHTACSHSMSPRQKRWKIKCIYTVMRDAEWSQRPGKITGVKPPSMCSGSSEMNPVASWCETCHRIEERA